MIKSALLVALNGVWPMIAIFTVILASLRITYLIYRKEKFILYKELLSLVFLIYILVLFYLVTYQENSYGGFNLQPFKEMFRYSIGSKMFFRNTIGNILLFLPFGLFVTSFINKRKMLPIFILTAISSLSIEFTQKLIGRVFDIDDVILNIFGGILGYLLWVILVEIRKRLPNIFRKEWFINVIMIIILISIVLYFTDWYTYILKMVI